MGGGANARSSDSIPPWPGRNEADVAQQGLDAAYRMGLPGVSSIVYTPSPRSKVLYLRDLGSTYPHTKYLVVKSRPLASAEMNWWPGRTVVCTADVASTATECFGAYVLYYCT
jgi:hypothetical protein